jgi:hypothetical protein
MKTKKKIVVMAGFVMVLFFMTASVFAEVKQLGPNKFLGLEFNFCTEYINESWVSQSSPGATSQKHYGGLLYYNRDTAMITVNYLMNIVLKEKTLSRIDSFEDKNAIDKKATHSFAVAARECDNGEIFIEIFEIKTGRTEVFRFK